MDMMSSFNNQDIEMKESTSLVEEPQNNKYIEDLPFYCIRETPSEAQLNGSTNLILYNQLQHQFNKYCCKKVKEQLGSFLSQFPSNIDTLQTEDNRENSTLKSLFAKQTISNEIHVLTNTQLTAFRLHPGPLPEKYIKMIQGDPAKSSESKSDGGSTEKKPKKSKRSEEEGGGGGHDKPKKKKKEKKKKKKSETKDNQ